MGETGRLNLGSLSYPEVAHHQGVMDMLSIISQNQITMGTREIADLLNKQHSNIKISAERLRDKGVITTLAMQEFEHNGNIYSEYRLQKRDCLVLVAQNCPEFTAAIVDRWQELETAQQKPLSQLEIIAKSALALVEQEKKLKQIESAQLQLENKFDQLKESYQILPKRPANAESITFIRNRINKKYGLPSRIIEDVLYNFPYSPKPAGQVRNSHQDAGNSTYTVWNNAEVSRLFKRFVNECEMVTKTQAVHPSIDGRFKLIGFDDQCQEKEIV